MVYPLLAAYYGVTPEDTSAVVFHALARAGLHVSVLGVRGGFGGLADAMVQALESRGVEIRLGTPVHGLETAAGGVALQLEGGRAEHAGAVVAVPAAAAAGLLPGVPWLGEISTRSTAHLVLAIDRPLDTGWFGLSIPRREPPGGELAAVCVQSEKGTGLGGAGDALVVIPAPAVAETWARLPEDDIMDRAMPAVEQVLPGVGRRVREAAVLRLDDQVFVPAPGHFGRLRDWDGRGLPAGVVVAGEYLEAPTVEGAIRSGLAAAGAFSPAGA
jgi:oxygen-dependent protoporphyrinogen oxidase